MAVVPTLQRVHSGSIDPSLTNVTVKIDKPGILLYKYLCHWGVFLFFFSFFYIFLISLYCPLLDRWMPGEAGAGGGDRTIHPMDQQPDSGAASDTGEEFECVSSSFGLREPRLWVGSVAPAMRTHLIVLYSQVHERILRILWAHTQPRLYCKNCQI